MEDLSQNNYRTAFQGAHIFGLVTNRTELYNGGIPDRTKIN